MTSALSRAVRGLVGFVQIAGGGLALVAFFLPWVVATDGVLRLGFSGLSLGLGESPFFVFNDYRWLAPITLLSPLAAAAVVVQACGGLAHRASRHGRVALLSLLGLLPVAWLLLTTAEETVTAHAFEEFRLLGLGSGLTAAAFGASLTVSLVGVLLRRQGAGA